MNKLKVYIPILIVAFIAIAIVARVTPLRNLLTGATTPA